MVKNSTLEHKLATLPENPGVYLMRDAARTVIYVGKAKVLKNRVKSYFAGDGHDLHFRTQTMVSKVIDFDVIITATNEAALKLEATLIKRYKPKYNVLLKDDKSSPYIKITVKDDFPKISVFRGSLDYSDGSRYFGPFQNVSQMWDLVRLIRRVFKLREEKRASQKRKSGCVWSGKRMLDRPCLNYDIRQCSGPCAGKISDTEYKKLVDEVILLLEGKTGKLLKYLTFEMEKDSADMNFESAAAYRDRILTLKNTFGDGEIVAKPNEDLDVVALFAANDEAVISVGMVRSGKFVDMLHTLLDSISGLSDDEILSAFLEQYYPLVGSPPPTILLEKEVDTTLLADLLSEHIGKKVHFITPKRRGSKLEIIENVKTNAENYLRVMQLRRDEAEKKSNETLRDLAKILNLPSPPQRIECYDISTWYGNDSVGSMVVFEGTEPAKKEYSRFKIAYNTGAPDDYAMMREMLTRRLHAATTKLQRFSTLPDLMVIDGGKGQLNIAIEVLKELEMSVPVISLAKEFEEIFVPGSEIPIRLPQNSRPLHLLQSVRDEAHRFALSYQKKLRDKMVRESILDEIEGVGKKRKALLLRKFGSISKIAQSTPETLAELDGISLELAKNILEALREKQ